MGRNRDDWGSGRGGLVAAVGVCALVACALAAAAQAQILTPTPPPELWDTPAGEQLDAHAPEDLGEKYDLDYELGAESGAINDNVVVGFVTGNVGPTVQRVTPKDHSISIPRAKPTDAWQLVAGARHDRTDVIADSVTPFDAELHTVRFGSPKDGLAAGTVCAQAPEPFDEDKETKDAFRERVQRCRNRDASEDGPRVPVIYRYLETPDKGAHWREDYRGEVELDPDNLAKGGPGFVGAIDWIEPGRALAVGGTGVYPRRELRWNERDQYGRFNDCRDPAHPDEPAQQTEESIASCTPANPLKADVAGAGRAWLFEDGKWEEIDLSEQRKGTATGTLAWEETVNAGGDTGLWVPDPTDPQFPQQAAGNPTQCPNPLIGPKNPQGQPTCPKRQMDGVKETVTVEPAREGIPRAGIRGMTALALWTHSFDGELGFAGSLGQLWRWQSERDKPETGGFKKLYDALSPDPKDPNPTAARSGAEVHDAADLRFRVRELRPRLPGALESLNNRAFLGVTAGCCMPEVAGRSVENFPRLLGFNESPAGSSNNAKANTWYVNAGHWNPHTRDSDGDTNQLGGGTTGDASVHALTPAQAKRVNYRQDAPDSFYTFGYSRIGYGADRGPISSSPPPAVSIVQSPGGPPPARGREPASLIGSPFPIDQQGAPTGSLNQASLHYPRTLNASLSSARLVASDGDTDGVCVNLGSRCFSYARPDWAVGVLRYKGQGLAVSTHGQMRPYTSSSVKGGCTEKLEGTGSDKEREYAACQGQRLAAGTTPEFDQRRFDDSLRSRYFLTDSHSLNAIDMDDQTGAGWAVGGHGAILRFGSEAAAKLVAAGEPTPPTLRPRGARPLAERSPYQSLRPPVPPGGAGGVPALAERPLERLGKPKLRYAGAPDPERESPNFGGEYGEAVTEVVISRDGSEGWAIGPLLQRPYTSPTGGPSHNPTGVGIIQATLYHFDGRRWRRCDPFGVPGRLSPDPACESLKPLFFYRPPGSASIAPIRLTAAARVPHENDSDPSNDDEFEVVAVGTGYRASDSEPERSVILRYREGRWALEEEALREQVASDLLRDVAFAAPNDGWILGTQALYRFTGEQWVACHTTGVSDDGAPINQAACGNADLRLPQRVDSSGNNFARDTVGLAQAGKRVYLYGRRRVTVQQGGNETARFYPLLLYRERGEPWRANHDPGFGRQASDDELALQGQVEVLAIAQAKDGSYEGWAAGGFDAARAGGATNVGSQSTGGGWRANLMRLEDGAWSVWRERDASVGLYGGQNAPRLAALADAPPGTPPALASYTGVSSRGVSGVVGFTLAFDPERGRWVERPLPGEPIFGAIAPDGRGGYWLAPPNSSHFARLSATHPREVFSEVPSPVQAHERLTALASSADGSLWAGTNIAGTLYRYERTTGWERLSVPGWDPSKIVLPTPVRAIAVNERGVGVAVGKEGRIADIDGGSVRLDAASGTACDLAKIGTPELKVPCGTTRTLRAAAVAADDSAMVGGDFLALLWRPPGGEFRAIERPEAASSSTITGVSLPSPGRAFLTTDRGLVFAGELAGGHWSWRSESLNDRNQLLSADAFNQPQPLYAVAVRPGGTGYAVGARGLVLERTGEGEHPWRRVNTGFRDDLHSLALDAGGGPGVLIGAGAGQVLTLRHGRFQLARAGVPYGNDSGHDGGEEPEAGGNGGTPPIRSLALLPGVAEGQTEAWALSPGFPGRSGTSKLYHYASDPDEPLLDPVRTGRALADSPPPRAGELSLAAFGRTKVGDELEVTSRVVEELGARARRPGGPRATLFTGDVSERPTPAGPAFAGGTLAKGAGVPGGGPEQAYTAFRELVADPLDEAGVPLFGALGKLDIAEVRDPITNRSTNTGETYAWRQGMAARPWPRGRSETLFPREHAETQLTFRALADARLAVRHKDEKAGERDLPTGGASTHYAVDVLDEVDGEQRRLARLIVLDNSHRSLAASDPLQQPLEPKGGQSLWLEEMLCMRGERAPSPAARCTRSPDQQAIVLATTPTYSFGQGSQLDTAQDATLLESTLIRHRANLVVSGRFGINTRYWATAAGVHEPCPGGAYRDTPPRAGERRCDRDTQGVPMDPSQAATETADALRSLGPPADRGAEALAPLGAGVLPFVVASNAGGTLPDQSAQAKDGAWRGYTIVRLDPSGDPARTIVEQRPIYDWVRIQAQEFVLRPGQRMTLRGVGRSLAPSLVRFDGISNPAITHRYDLVEADPERPWVPRRTADGSYVPLDARVGTVDPQSGLIKTGRGNQERTFAIGMLSLGCSGTDVGAGSACDPSLPGVHTATYPLVFEPRRSFRPKPSAALAALPLPKVLSSAAATIQSPQAPPPVNPQTPPVDIPPPPTLPGLPTPSASPPAPPAPPAPPPPPVTPAATPLDLVTSAVGLNVAPQATVIPPPAPPIQPAPPGGARREARQRQAATQKSGAADIGSDRGADAAGDLGASSDPTHGSNSALRRDPVRADGASITTVAHADQPSAWARGALYGGGLTLAAALLALGWTLAGPRSRPRRRPPTAPAPAENRLHRG